MHNARTSTALRQLADLGATTSETPWRWSIVNLEPIGRIILPGHARQALTHSPGEPGIRARAVRVAWLLNRGGAGTEAWVDGRGRVYLPAWLRSLCDHGVLVGTRSTDGVVVVGSTRLLDGFGDRLTGPVR